MDFFSYFSRVGTVDLARNQLTKVEFQMFADLRFIDTIDLAENQISEVQREAFKNIYLTRINMSHNYIEEMAENAFRNCENMTVLGKKKKNIWIGITNLFRKRMIKLATLCFPIS